jgi:4-hydroxy-2-oxoheptanedioate aldolase
MKLAENTFKRALHAKQPQIGLWLGLANPYCAELCAGAGFDWLLLDAEHAPNDVRTLLAQLQAIAAYPVKPVVRIACGDTVLIKQVLDIGAQTLLIPLVETAEQARSLVAATRYPPEGVRGVGSALARASRWNRIGDYLARADEEICLLVQVETKRGLENIEQIAAVEGVDGIFIGPADLSAALGYRGNPGHPQVQAAIEDAMARVHAAGKGTGILTADEKLARRYLELGSNFVAVGVDTSLLARATQELAARFKHQQPAPTAGGGVY